MSFGSLFLELKKLNMFDYVGHKVTGVDTVVILRNVQTEEEMLFSLPNAQARLFIRVLGLLKEYKEVDV